MGGLRIAVAGRSGQVAQAIARAGASRGMDIVCRGRPELDLHNIDSIAGFLAGVRPSVVVNAAAYTAVDKAETEPDVAFAANAAAPGLLATMCEHYKLPLIHISTDYVFNGVSCAPYREDDALAPLGVYGASKAAGEQAVRSACRSHLILRTSWVYSENGSNFVKTMLRLAAERDVVRVVGDQRGSPTYAADLAEAILTIAERVAGGSAHNAFGTFHVTGAGETTWHGFAAEIFHLAGSQGSKIPRLEEITTAEFPLPARRPAYSVLDNTKCLRTFNIRLPDWRDSLAGFMNRIGTAARERATA